MTSDEAISIMNAIVHMLEPQYDTDRIEDAVEMAIKALEQEQCTDMVSRDAMWDVLQRLYGTEGELVEELMSLPPVLPMPKMGRWIKDKCSICGEERAWYGQNPPYCPDCGSYNGGEG
jgi:hypothetical protein